MPDNTVQTIEVIEQRIAYYCLDTHTDAMLAKWQRGAREHGSTIHAPWSDPFIELLSEQYDTFLYALVMEERGLQMDYVLDTTTHMITSLEEAVPMCPVPLRFFVSGPYRHADPLQVDRHIENARNAKAALMRRGHYTYCPHSESAWFEDDFPDIPDYRHLHNCIAWLEHADAIFLLPDWEESEGAMVEHGYATSRGLPVYTDILQVPLVEGTLWEANHDSLQGS